MAPADSALVSTGHFSVSSEGAVVPNRLRVPKLPGIDEVTSGAVLGRVRPGLDLKFPVKLPVTIPVRLRPWLFRDIAYFSYAIPDPGPVDGETTTQEDIFTVSTLTGGVRRVTDDRALPVMKSDRDPAWSPSRDRLAIHTASEPDPVSWIAVISPTTGAVIDTLVPGHSPEWLDATTILFLDTVDAGTEDARTDVFAVSTTTSVVNRVTDVGVGASIGTLSWHPAAGLALGYAEETGTVPRYSIAVIPAAAVGAARTSGTPVGRSGFSFVTPAATRAAAPDWSPTADRIAIATWTDGSPTRVGILTVASGAITLLPGPTSATENDFGPAFSRDGRMVAFTRGEEDTWSEIWLHHIPSSHSRQLTDDARTRFKGSLDW